MIRWTYFPNNQKIPIDLIDIIDVFKHNENQISSDSHSLTSNQVLETISQGLTQIGVQVETSKRNEDKIRIPVLFGEQGNEYLAFEADGLWTDHNVVIEVEAGRAVTNYQFLKDYFQACMMYNVDYFCIAVRKTYRSSNDYEKVCRFFNTIYISNRINTQLKGILVIGY